MSKIIEILACEEGYREQPYTDSEGYPTVGCGILIGPKNASLANYQFSVSRRVGDIWMRQILDEKIGRMKQVPAPKAALEQCNDARADVLYSMAYQLGIGGLSAFKNTLLMIAEGHFDAAADGMLSSLWARQTPVRAHRQAEVMRSGTYDAYQGLI